MIESNELRIGNWVNAVTCDKSLILDQIWELNESYFITKFGWDECKPIHLDEEWMNKCGFIYEGCSYEYHDDGKEYREFESRNGLGDFIEMDGFFLPKPYYFGQAFGENFKLKYVHQLQNLYFALTGEELTIKTKEND